MKKNILYLLNHKTLTDFEVPILIRNNYGVYITKKYYSLDNTNSIAMESIYKYDTSLINITRADYNFLNNIDFFDSNNIINNDKLINILNNNFNIFFITLLSYDIVEYLSKHFTGTIYFRFFGLESDYSYYDRMINIGIIPENRRNVKYIFSYNEIIHFENTKNSFFTHNNSYFIPLGLPNNIFIQYENTYNTIFNDNKFVFICSKINICPYYTNVYNNFNKLFNNTELTFKILGKNNENIERIDNRILNNLSDDVYYKEISNSLAMYYHSKEERHLHYHPLEAIIIGIPIIFHSESLLSTYLKESPGRCFSDLEAIDKLLQIKNGDILFKNSIINYQNSIKYTFKIDHNLNIFDCIIDINTKCKKIYNMNEIIIDKLKEYNFVYDDIITTDEIISINHNTVQTGIGDLLLISLLKNYNILKGPIYINTGIYVNNDNTINKPLENFEFKLKLLEKFKMKNNIIFFYDTNVKYTEWIHLLHDFNEFTSLQKYVKFNKTIEDEYIIFHTKCRFMYNFNYTELKSKLLSFYKNYKTNYKIILLGERYMPYAKEINENKIITIYEELLELKNNNDVIDLTTPNIYDNLDFETWLNDVSIIHYAKYNIIVGNGGHYCISAIFGQNTIVYGIPEITLLNNTDNYYDINSFFNKLYEISNQPM